MSMIPEELRTATTSRAHGEIASEYVSGLIAAKCGQLPSMKSPRLATIQTHPLRLDNQHNCWAVGLTKSLTGDTLTGGQQDLSTGGSSRQPGTSIDLSQLAPKHDTIVLL